MIRSISSGIRNNRPSIPFKGHGDEFPPVLVATADGDESSAGLHQPRVGGDGMDFDVERASNERAIKGGDEVA